MQQQFDDENVENKNTTLKVQEKHSSERKSDDAAQIATQPTDTAEKVSFSERMRTHPSIVVRGISHVLYSIWILSIIIGGFIAWIISLLFI